MGGPAPRGGRAARELQPGIFTGVQRLYELGLGKQGVQRPEIGVEVCVQVQLPRAHRGLELEDRANDGTRANFQVDIPVPGPGGMTIGTVNLGLRGPVTRWNLMATRRSDETFLSLQALSSSHFARRKRPFSTKCVWNQQASAAL